MSTDVNTFRINQPNYYHREYKNDFPSDTSNEGQCLNPYKRVALVALPFLTLYKPLSFPASFVMGGLRTFTSATQLLNMIKNGESKDVPWAALQTGISVIALAGTIFAHPLGMLISTANDLAIDVNQLITHLKNRDHKKALENCLSIINNSLYLALFLRGGLEIAIASLAMQIIVGIYHSQAEFRAGHYLEGAGHALMFLVRGNQLTAQIRALQMRNECRITSLNETDTDERAKSHPSETFNVSIAYNNGHVFHIADYSNGIRITTCLDGDLLGYQSITFNNSKIMESSNVKWYVDHFVHEYPNGRIDSYLNRQVPDLYLGPISITHFPSG